MVHSECERFVSLRALKWVLPALAVLFITLISCAYAGRATERVRQQVENVRTHFSYDREMRFRFHRDVERIKELTRFSPNVTFVSHEDGYYYYESGYIPQNPYSSIDARLLLVKDFKDFLEKALRNGHYLIIPLGGYQGPAFSEVLAGLRVRHVKLDSEMLIMSDNPIG